MMHKDVKWKSLEEVHCDMNLCLHDLQEFEYLYCNEPLPGRWTKFAKEGFKNILSSYIELVKVMIYYANREYKLTAKNFISLLEKAVDYRLLPVGSDDVIDSLRKLRNQNTQGYDVPDFEDMYEAYLENKQILIEIYEYCGKLKDKLN